MEKIYKIIIILVFFMSILVSCVFTTITDNNTEKAKKVYNEMTKSMDNDYGYLCINITNKAENIKFRLDSLEICNIIIDNKKDVLKKGNIILMRMYDDIIFEYGSHVRNAEEKIISQNFIPWEPHILPYNSNKSYIKIYGKIYTIIGDGTDFLLYSGEMFIPLYGNVVKNGQSNIEMDLYDGCPWYIERNGKMEKVLASINFNVSVDDWDTVLL